MGCEAKGDQRLPSAQGQAKCASLIMELSKKQQLQQRSRHFTGKKAHIAMDGVQLNGLDFCIFFRQGRLDGWSFFSFHW